MLLVSALYIYPVKSLGGIRLASARLTDRGLQWDRRWMLVDDDGRFLSQREHPALAQFATTIDGAQLTICHRTSAETVNIPLHGSSGNAIETQIWDDRCMAEKVDPAIDLWFSKHLGARCQLVHMPDHTRREVDSKYAHDHEITSFSDAFPILMIGQASLDELNSRLSQPLPMNRFRPNIVFEGGQPFEEDEMAQFEINSIRFTAAKPCARCVITTIDQQTLQRGTEPLKTLATYRRMDHKILFGQNLLYFGTGNISVGDPIHVKTRKPALQFQT